MKLKTEICVAITKNYFQLTLAQRYQIQVLKAVDHGQTSIANIIGVNNSTVYRELKRNISKTGKVYSAHKAQAKTDNRHKIKPNRFCFVLN